MRPPFLKLPARRAEFRGNVKPAANPVFTVVAETGRAVITIFAEIGGPAGVTAERINTALEQLGQQPILLKINSLGGDAFEGVAIYNLLRAHPQPITAQVLGIAASAASIVAMAADQIQMAKNSQMMIHQAWMVAVGNADLFEAAAETLHKIDAALAETYAVRSGQSAAQITAMMAKETFLSADEAIDLGLADALLDADAAPAPQTMSEAPPQSRRELEARLRQTGMSKAAAAKVVAGGWPALDHTPENDQVSSLISSINAATISLRKAINL
jgi:ATP-dependent Clp endopeptidase proteolytic subunit ClpP